MFLEPIPFDNILLTSSSQRFRTHRSSREFSSFNKAPRTDTDEFRSSATRMSAKKMSRTKLRRPSIERKDVEVVSVNDPFIDAKYAVRTQLPLFAGQNLTRAGVHDTI